MSENKNCEDCIEDEYNNLIETLKDIGIGTDAFNEFGLGFNFVEAGTFDDQPEPYYRYQISWGGPSEEIRIYDGGRAEYWFLDWFDGANMECSDEPVIKEIINFFDEVGLIDWAALIPERCENCDEIISPETGLYCDECRPYNIDISLYDLSRDEVIEALEALLDDIKDESGNIAELNLDDAYIEEAE